VTGVHRGTSHRGARPSRWGAMYIRVCDNFGPDAGAYRHDRARREDSCTCIDQKLAAFYWGTSDFRRLPGALLGLNHLRLGQCAINASLGRVV
jgi:hypothetical protein